MRRLGWALTAGLAYTLTLGLNIQGSTQEPVAAALGENDAVLTTLADIAYPPLARTTRITGDVEIALEIESDGRVRSAAVISGHPLLARAAMESAKLSQFECRKCERAPVAARIVYTFQLLDRESCAPSKDPLPQSTERDDRVPGVTRSQNHVTVSAATFYICDPGPDRPSKVRSWKCLYLWRCASPRLIVYE